MSRSYKKTPYCGDKKGKIKKRIANHTVRQYLKRNMDCKLSPGAHRKLYETWDICDYCWITPWEEYWERELRIYKWLCSNYPNRNHEIPNKEECYRKWLRYYRNK